ncbi:MAG: sigma-54 dependent transcriptional regulator [Planctomycetota bacterium]|nr:sigma-54 dependent transcriptional regulator [Planctomycetota bacterium]
MPKTILLVEDEEMLRESLAELLAERGFQVLQAPNGKVAYETMLARPVDLVLSDIRMPEMDGMALLARLRELAPETPVIMITAYGTVESAVQALRAGASDYLLKPVQFDDMLLKMQHVLDHHEVLRASRVMIEQMSAQSVIHNLVGRSASMLRLLDMVQKLSAVKSNVLIMGESGTGKELFARAIHYNGVARDKPFVPVNCGAIPENLVESELFGYQRGAFTGAHRDRVGYFEAADGGTLFLDEISSFPLPAQSAVLRALDSKVIVPVGDTRPRAVDVRIIAASNRNLEEMVAAGEFREDLLYRLNVVKMELPPLRHRKEDIPLLVHHFLAKFSVQMNKQVTTTSNAAMRMLLSYAWPGNVRELENVIERSVIFVEGSEVDVQHLAFASGQGAAETGESLKDALREFERQLILCSLRKHAYNKVETAKTLQIGVSSLYRKMEEMGIPTDEEALQGPEVAAP